MTVNQQQCEARGSRESVLNLRPRGRGVFAVFLSIWGSRELFHHQLPDTSIQIDPSSAHERFTLLLNSQWGWSFKVLPWSAGTCHLCSVLPQLVGGLTKAVTSPRTPRRGYF